VLPLLKIWGQVSIVSGCSVPRPVRTAAQGAEGEETSDEFALAMVGATIPQPNIGRPPPANPILAFSTRPAVTTCEGRESHAARGRICRPVVQIYAGFPAQGRSHVTNAPATVGGAGSDMALVFHVARSAGEYIIRSGWSDGHTWAVWSAMRTKGMSPHGRMNSRCSGPAIGFAQAPAPLRCANRVAKFVRGVSDAPVCEGH